MFLETLAQHGSQALRDRAKELAGTLRDTDSTLVEVDLQTWPDAAMQEGEPPKILLIGISSSSDREWTHDQRPAPEQPRPDAWIYIPGKLLVVFECKNDEHSLDATQISAYAHALGLLKDEDNVPRAKPGSKLASATEAQAVQKACTDRVLDVPWTAVVDALQLIIQREESVGSLSRWLCGKAAAYIQWNVYPPYRGIQTILDWLKGPNTPERCFHLRRLVGKMGDVLAQSAQGLQRAITFAQRTNEDWDLARGAGSAVYVKLERDEQPLRRTWLGREVDGVLWFQFAEDDNQRIGLEYYLQSSGSHPIGKGADAWILASKRHLDCAGEFEKLVEAWIKTGIGTGPAKWSVIVSTVRFRGKSCLWKGGGVKDLEGLKSSRITPQEALEFLKAHRRDLWCFPELGPGAQPHVRKPALSLVAPLEAGKLAKCGEDGQALQTILQAAADSITA
jgi:hypothetical protein